MPEAQTPSNVPGLPVALQLDSTFEHALDVPLRAAFALQLSELLTTLGIPGEPLIEISRHAAGSAAGGQLLQVRVNGERCEYSDEVIERIYSYVQGVPLASGVRTQMLAKMRAEESADPTLNATRDALAVELLSRTCLEIIKLQPSVLLGPEQVAAYQARLDRNDEASPRADVWPPERGWLSWVLRGLVDLKISLTGVDWIKAELLDGLGKKKQKEEVLEGLFTGLAADVLEIQLPRDYLQRLTTGDGDRTKFTTLFDDLFSELGVVYPPLRFVPVETLKPNSFTFKINHLTTTPRVGLDQEQCIVNQTPDELRKLDIPATAALQPELLGECALIRADMRHAAEAAGLRTWNPLDYLTLAGGADLRENSHCFVHRRSVQSQLNELQHAFPTLTKYARAHNSDECITYILRALSVENITIRNLRLVLERLLDFDYIVVDPMRYIVLDDRLPVAEAPTDWLSRSMDLVAYVRANMKHYMAYKYTQGTNSLNAYLIAPEFEQGLTHDQRLDDAEHDKFLDALRLEIKQAGAPAAGVVIITTVDARPVVHSWIMREFPRLSVLAYQELDPGLNINTLGRITAS
jgi:hypothetical protein